jgi:hypothetical protein
MGESSPASLDGVKMRVITTAPNGVVGADTIFTFQQRGRVVTAHYVGGRIVSGFLAGTWQGDQLHFRYVQVADADTIDSGQSVATLTRSSAGRLRLEERFEWATKPGSGVNVFEEI